MNFRELIEREAARGLDPSEPPRTKTGMAERIEVSRVHLYSLMKGKASPPPWAVTRIAQALGRPRDEVQSALEQSREEALLED